MWFTYFLETATQDTFFSKIDVFGNNAVIKHFNVKTTDNAEYMRRKQESEKQKDEMMRDMYENKDKIEESLKKLRDSLQKE